MVDYIINFIFYCICFSLFVVQINLKYERKPKEFSISNINWFSLIVIAFIPMLNLIFLLFLLCILISPDIYYKFKQLYNKLVNLNGV